MTSITCLIVDNETGEELGHTMLLYGCREEVLAYFMGRMTLAEVKEAWGFRKNRSPIL
jgi:hypothetical protein